MGAQRRITEDQRTLIARLIHVEGRSHADVQKLAGQGIYGLEPFYVAKSTISEISREERIEGALELGEAALADIYDRLARDALAIGHRELERLKATQGKLDADHYLKLARALRELQPLAKPNVNDVSKRDTFLGEISEANRLNAERTSNETDESDSPSEPSIDQASSLPLAA